MVKFKQMITEEFLEEFLDKWIPKIVPYMAFLVLVGIGLIIYRAL